MRIAFFADIHANREAFEACLQDADERGHDRKVILGDVVGYGADPVWCTHQVMDLQQSGAIVLRGNHDGALTKGTEQMNDSARTAMDWTARQLSPAEISYLTTLPLQHREEDRLYVHANAWAPALWDYINGPREAERSMRLTDAKLSFCGHTHVPKLYYMNPNRPAAEFTPLSGKAVPLSPLRHYLIVAGSVGQPRDAIPLASWGLFDTLKREWVQYRVSYDIDSAAQKIRAAGLPERLAKRLYVGG